MKDRADPTGNEKPDAAIWGFLKDNYSALPGKAKLTVYFVLLALFVVTWGAASWLTMYLMAVERDIFRVGFLTGVVTDSKGEKELSPDEMKRRGIRISAWAKTEAIRAFYDNETHSFAVFSSRLDIRDAKVQFVAEGIHPEDPMRSCSLSIDLKDWLVDRRRKVGFVSRLHVDKDAFELKLTNEVSDAGLLRGSTVPVYASSGVAWAGEILAAGNVGLVRALFEVIGIVSPLGPARGTAARQTGSSDGGVYLEIEADKDHKKRMPRNGRIMLGGDKRFVGLATGIPWTSPPVRTWTKLWIVSEEQGIRQEWTIPLVVASGTDQTVEQGGMRLTYRISGPIELRGEIDRLGSSAREERERASSNIAVAFAEEAIEPLWKAITYGQSTQKDSAIIGTLKQMPCRVDSELEHRALSRLLYDTPAYRNQQDYNRIWEAVYRKPKCS